MLDKLKTLVALVIGAVVGYYFAQLTLPATGQETEANEKVLKPLDVQSIKTKLSQVSELATVSYQYTDLAQHEKSEKLWGMKIPFSTSKILIQYSGTIKAGIDLAQAQFAVEQDTVVTFMLPKAKILSHDIDQGSLRVLNQSNGLFSSIKIEDFNKFCAEHRDSMECRALNTGLLQTAQEKSQESLSLITDPLIAEGYTVRLTTLPDSLAVTTPEVPAPAPAKQ